MVILRGGKCLMRSSMDTYEPLWTSMNAYERPMERKLKASQ